MPVLAPPIRLSETELVALFIGTEDTTGYAHPALVRELCAYWQPKSLSELATKFYPDLGHLSDLPKPVRVALREGLALWRAG